MNNRKCPNCQLVNWTTATACARCGYPLTEEADAAAAYTTGDLAAQATPTATLAAEPGALPNEIAPAYAPSYEQAYESQPGATNEVNYLVPPFNEIGSVISQTFKLYKNNFLLIAKLVLFAAIPFAIGQAALVYRINTGDRAGMAMVGLNVLIFTIVRWSLIPPTIIYAMLKVMRTGSAPTIGESYRWGASRWWRVTLALLLGTFASFGLLALGGVPLGIGITTQSSVLLGLSFFVFIALLVPCVILSLGFSLVTEVATIEHVWPVQALKRSWELTKGVRGSIFGLLFVLGLIVGIGGGIISAICALGGMLISPVVGNVVSQVISEVFAQLMTIAALIVYLGMLAPAEQLQRVDAAIISVPASY
jgi:hypothetical protein